MSTTIGDAPRFGESAEGFRTEEMILNMGPQHPSTHGVLRLVMTLEGETVTKCTPIIGYLHRGIEKILENRPYMGGIRYMDNSDYLSPMLNETAYAGAVEQLMGIEPPARAEYIRLIVNEMQRIASHLVAIGTYMLDLGAFTPILYCFRDREGLLSLFEEVGGSRFNVNYMRVGGVLHDLPTGWLQRLEAWLNAFDHSWQELNTLITGNEIFMKRTQGVGYIDPEQAIAYGMTGPIARASGVEYDLRVQRPYGAYREIATTMVVRQDGDAFGRYMCRMLEMKESQRLIREAMAHLPGGAIGTRTPIALRPPRGETYFAVESSKGELGIYLISDGSEYPYRAKIRGPSFVNLQIVPEIMRGHKMGDVVAILGSIDFILGEVDR
ncbi:MAG TPA: NADH-quinone oxidoreductase subunit D [Ktedonobacterales bacterium]|nr:NADH-quinone oxidoreductase subunit D [Ktedonobacterales bacterium]